MLFSTLFFCYYFVQFSNAFHGAGNLFGFVFGFQKLCFCRCGTFQRHTDVRIGRLLGGETITPHQFPWLASISTGSHVIGGSLISDRHVLTTASMLYGKSASAITVTLGAHDRCGSGGAALNSSVAELLLHPAYSPTNSNNDIALVTLRHVVPFSHFVSPVCLPYAEFHESEQVAWIATWTERENYTCTPRVVTLPVLPARNCVQGATDMDLVTPDKGCLGPLGSKSVICKSDVGAPVMSRWHPGAAFRLTGVVSTSECDKKTAPLYTRVSDHLSWIYQQIRNDCLCF